MAATGETLRILAALDAADLARARRQVRDIASAYVLAWDEVSGDLADALDDLAAARAAGEAPQALVLRSTRLRKALSVIADKLHELADTGALRITRDLRQAVRDAGAGQVALIASTLPAGQAGMAVAWDAVNRDAITAIIERATQQIHAAHLPLSDEAVAAMRSELIRGLAAGSNPKSTALRMLARCEGHFNGGIARAMRISRTETLDAMRAASRLADLSNPDLVTGWQWVASLGPRTCSSCWSQHGSIHPADEPGPLDHHNGRCARIPVPKSWRDLGFDIDEPASVIPDAQTTFDAMGRDAQRQVLGSKGLAAYEQGRFPMSAWSVRKDTPEWRPAYYAAKPPTLTPRRAVA